MQQNKFSIYFIFILISIHPSILINLCPTHSSCNCTLTNDTNLEISCNSTLFPSELPTLINNTLQTSVTYLHVSSSIVGISGPLTILPINICSSYPSISILNLSSNTITGFLNTSELACLGTNLIHVDLSNNFINDIDRNFFKGNRQLQIINLSYNNLITMPMIDGEYFTDFISTITLMNFSYNQIINIDFWPLFVKTGNSMTIDMSHNIITNYTNNIPVYVEQFTQTPDPRILYLNNNQLTRLSDHLLEQYGACSTISSISTAYFIVGISNIFLTNNPLICDCEPYNLITYINDHLNDFPMIYNKSALLTQAQCTLPSSINEQSYIFFNFTQLNLCQNYTLPQISNTFCSVYSNTSNSTLPPPTYWPSTITTISIGNNTTTVPGEGGNGSSNNAGSNTNTSTNSSSPSWYIILGIVLGLILILCLIALGIFLCKDRFLPEKCRSKLRNNDNNLNNSYEPIIRHSQLSSQTTFPPNGIQPHRTSISTSTCEVDDHHNGRNSDEEIHPEQETQTCFQIIRSKAPPGPSRSTRDPQRLPSNHNNSFDNSHRERKRSLSTATNITTNTTNTIKGIPIPSNFPNENDILPDTSTSEFSITSIPVTPSKRAKLLPQLKSGLYLDSTNKNLLNTSAGAIITNQRQRRQSLIWTDQQYQNGIASPLTRPQSTTTQKTIFNQDDSSDEEGISIPTVESLTNKSSKPLRALPLLNITVVSAWIGENTDQK